MLHNIFSVNLRTTSFLMELLIKSIGKGNIFICSMVLKMRPDYAGLQIEIRGNVLSTSIDSIIQLNN